MRKTALEPPLSSAVTFILLSLAESDRHGYGILQDVARLSGGTYRMGPGTLYDNLRTLLGGGLVGETEVEEPGEEPRRIYRLTASGSGILADELRRLDALVAAGRTRLAQTRPGEAR